MPRLPGPTESPEEWQFMTLGGIAVPGTVKVSGGHSRKDDTEQVPGQDGVTTTILGYQPAQFDVEITLWDDRQYSEYMALYQRFRPRKTEGVRAENASRALKVQGAAFQVADVRELTIYEITVPRQSSNQIYTASIRLREFIPEAKRNKGTTAGKGKPTNLKQPGQDVSLEVPITKKPSGDDSALGKMKFPTYNPQPGYHDVFEVPPLL